MGGIRSVNFLPVERARLEGRDGHYWGEWTQGKEIWSQRGGLVGLSVARQGSTKEGQSAAAASLR